MKLRFVPIVLVVFLLIISLFAQSSSVTKGIPTGNSRDLKIGVDIAYYDIPEFKAEVDEISSCTNVIVIGTTGITYNITLLDEACQYVYDKGLSFIIYVQTIRANQTEWFQNATAKWGDYFLGIYSAADEFGGKQLDLGPYRAVWNATNYSDAANQFVANLTWNLKRTTRYINDSTTFPMFISDYALYWFDYKAGVNTVLAEFGWNYSQQLNVALCRGAATAQNKDWGVMIAWTYTEPPYIESGPELYQDLILAYNNGAKYILIFDSNKNYTDTILKPEHFEALKQFWQYVQSNPRKSYPISERVACVLPKDYGYGFRGPNDKIWGIWETDDIANKTCISVNRFLEMYGDRLDIIYDEGLTTSNTYGYSQLLPWDYYQDEPSPPPTLLPTASPSPSPSSDPTQSPSSSPNPTPYESPSSTPTLSPPILVLTPPPEFSQKLIESQEPAKTSLLPTLAVFAIAAIIAVVIFLVEATKFATKKHGILVKPLKLTFRGAWNREAFAGIQVSGQADNLSNQQLQSKYNGTLNVDWVTEFFGKVNGTLNFEGKNGDKLFVNMSGTKLVNESYSSFEFGGSYRITGGTGQFEGAGGCGTVSAHFTIASNRWQGDLTEGIMTGAIALPQY